MNTQAEPREPRTDAGRDLIEAVRQSRLSELVPLFTRLVLAIEDEVLAQHVIRAAADFEADEARQRVVDAALLARALDNLWEARWGPLPMPKGQTTINLENAEAIAVEYERLAALDALGEPGGTG